MISGFVLGVLKLIAPKTKEDIPSTPVKPNRRKRILPRPKAPKDE